MYNFKLKASQLVFNGDFKRKFVGVQAMLSDLTTSAKFTLENTASSLALLWIDIANTRLAKTKKPNLWFGCIPKFNPI